jgi:hypothetical protein
MERKGKENPNRAAQPFPIPILFESGEWRREKGEKLMDGEIKFIGCQHYVWQNSVRSTIKAEEPELLGLWKAFPLHRVTDE